MQTSETYATSELQEKNVVLTLNTVLRRQFVFSTDAQSTFHPLTTVFKSAFRQRAAANKVWRCMYMWSKFTSLRVNIYCAFLCIHFELLELCRVIRASPKVP